MSETAVLVAILVPILIVAIVFHEVAHGWVAWMLGDPTAKQRGRLTLNPIPHVDPVGTLLVPGAMALIGGPVFGWAKPVPVIKQRLKNPRYGMVAVAAAGPGTNLLLALIGAVALGLFGPALLSGGGASAETIATAFQYFLLINVFLAFFNLLPIPPFDGSHIVEGLLPPRMAKQYERLRPFGMLLFVGLVALTWFAPDWGVLENTVMPPVRWMMEQYLSVADAIAR